MHVSRTGPLAPRDDQELPVRTVLPWWERSGRLILSLYFVMPGLLSVVVSAARYSRGELNQTATSSITLGLSLVYLAAGGLALTGRLVLAMILLAVDLAVSIASLGGLLGVSAADMGGELQILMSVVLSGAGVAWVLGRRYARDDRVQRALAISLVIAFALNVPILGTRLGTGVGDALAPAPVSRIAEPGERLPEFRLADLSGSIVPLDEPGRLYVLNFWATWCVPCRLELPHLLDMIEALPESAPVRLMAVNTEGLGREAVEAFLEKEGLAGLDVFTDPSGSTQILETGSIPLTVVIRDRTLLTRHIGYSADTIERLRAEIVSYVEDGGPEEPAAPPS